jgi:predicted nucleic acid-binding protein
MLILCDTNVLLRSAKPDNAHHLIALEALSELRRRGDEPAVVPQCCYEYFAVATRPAESNGLGMEPSDALSDLADILELFRLLRDERAVFESWRDLIAKHAVRGKAVHDARLVAAMLRHRVTHLLTFNVGDFGRYTEMITVVDPQSLATAH